MRIGFFVIALVASCFAQRPPVGWYARSLGGIDSASSVHARFNYVIKDTAGENLTNGQVCYRKAGGWFKAVANDSTKCKGMLVMAIGTNNSTATGYFLVSGQIALTSLTANSIYLLDTTTAGAISLVQPSLANESVRQLGYARTTTDFFFMVGSMDRVKQ